MSTSLDDVKARAKAGQVASTAAPLIATDEAAPARRPLPANVAADLQKLESDLAAQQEEEIRVPLEVLPENMRKPVKDPRYAHNLFDNPSARKKIEDRCREMDFGDLVITGRVSQDVPIIPKALVVRFQTLLNAENMWIDMEVGKRAPADFQARQTWTYYMRLAMTVAAINGQMLPAYLDSNGQVVPAKADERLAALNKFPERFIELISINFNWFNWRVESLFEDDFEQIKNG